MTGPGRDRIKHKEVNVTVVATLITKACTVHASDSLITTTQPNGDIQLEEWEASKIIPVRPFRGAMLVVIGWTAASCTTVHRSEEGVESLE
jgi:hypothetical protein